MVVVKSTIHHQKARVFLVIQLIASLLLHQVHNKLGQLVHFIPTDKLPINVEDNNVAEFSISVAKFSVYFA